jgi:hypothetical protein
MDKASRSQELELAERTIQSGEIYNLSGLSDGTAEVASPFSTADAQEVHKLLAACASGSDLEYPSPRHVLRHGYRREFKVGELNRLVVSDPERGSVEASRGLPYVVGAPQGKDDFGAPGRVGDRDDAVGSLSPVAAAMAGASAAVGLVLLVLAIASDAGPALPLAVSIAVFTTVISVAIWRAGQASASPRASEDGDDRWSDLWALRDGASIREAISVGLRTGGLGLLVRPRDPVEDEATETDEAEKVSGSPR